MPGSRSKVDHTCQVAPQPLPAAAGAPPPPSSCAPPLPGLLPSGPQSASLPTASLPCIAQAMCSCGHFLDKQSMSEGPLHWPQAACRHL